WDRRWPIHSVMAAKAGMMLWVGERVHHDGRNETGECHGFGRCSSKRGMISTKLQGRWRLSSCHLRTPCQASRQAPVEPGRQKISVPCAMPPQARDWMVEVPTD